MTISVLKNDVISIHEILNKENSDLRKFYKKELNKSKLKKWFWVIPVGVLSYTIGTL